MPLVVDIRTNPVIWEIFQELAAEESAKGRAAGRAAGLAEGLAEGKVEGERRIVRRLMEKRFGRLPARAVTRLEEMPAKRFDGLAGRRLGHTRAAGNGLGKRRSVRS